MKRFSSICLLMACLFAWVGVPSSAWAQSGHVLNGVGPMDQGWSGAGMANPQDALTGLHWNPATLTTYDATLLDISLQLLFPTTDLTSSVAEGTMGPDNPPVTLTGTTASDAGPFPIPAVGFVYRPRPTRWALGASAFGVGGFGVDYAASDPASPDMNPITLPQSMGGFGAITSSFALFQVAPTVAYQLTDHVSVGLAPTLDVGFLEVTPFPAAAPDPSGYPEGSRTSAFGVGFQAGVHVADLNGFHAGVSFKSPQQFEDYAFEAGERRFTFNLDYPMILSAAIGYSGFERLELAADVRYIDFEHTDGFGTVGFDADGAMTGFGWSSIVVVAVGAQVDVTDRLPVRVGYAYNECPIEDAVAFYNVASPAVVQHHLSGGLSYRVTPYTTVSAAVQYALPHEVSGAMQNPQMIAPFGTSAVPGTEVTSELSTFTAVIGLSLRLR